MDNYSNVFGGLANTALNAGLGFISQNRQNQFNLEQWQREVDYNNEMWEKNNAYNSPVAQMARYKEAGLNPNLIYGNAANTHSDSLTAPHAVRQSFDPSSAINQGISTYMQLRQLAQTIKESESRIQKNDSEVNKNNTIANWNITKNAYDLLRKNAYEKTDYFTNRGLAALNDVINGSLEVQKNRLNNAWLASTLDNRIAAIDFQNKLWQSATAMNKAHTNLFNAQKSYYNSQRSYIDDQHTFYNKTSHERFRSMTNRNDLTEEQILTEGIKRNLYRSRSDYTDVKRILAPLQLIGEIGIGIGKLF